MQICRIKEKSVWQKGMVVNMGDILKFTIMWKNEKIDDVVVDRDKCTVEVTKYSDHVFHQPFHMEPITIKNVYQFVKRRVFDEERPDKEELLAALGLEEYNPYEIMRKTHGANYDDYIWVKFSDDDKDLTWEKVKFRD